jgi:hypothetical protein
MSSKATHNDAASTRILEAIGRRIRPYRERDICGATKLSMHVVRSPCRLLSEAGLIRERWVGLNGPYWEVTS